MNAGSREKLGIRVKQATRNWISYSENGVQRKHISVLWDLCATMPAGAHGCQTNDSTVNAGPAVPPCLVISRHGTVATAWFE